MPHTFRIASAINPADPYWVQVQEAVFEKSREFSVDLIAIKMIDYPDSLVDQQHAMALLEEFNALELDAFIAGALPVQLVKDIPSFGIPLILLGATDIRHPKLVSARGYYKIAETAGHHLANCIGKTGNVLIVGGEMPVSWQDDGKERLAGIRDALSKFPNITVLHIPSLWSYDYDFIYNHIKSRLEEINQPFQAIFGLSDGLALVARDAALSLGLVNANCVIMGIGGTPIALAEIMAGSMQATMEIRTDFLGIQAFELAYQAAQRQTLPTHIDFANTLVTSENVTEVAAKKLLAIANLPNRLVRTIQRQRQERITQIETSLEINKRIGSILDMQKLSLEIANVIRTNYGYDDVQFFTYSSQENELTLFTSEIIRKIPLDQIDRAGIIAQSLQQNAPIFIPDSFHSVRFSPDLAWPNTRTRVVLPIHLRDSIIGLLDLHSHQLQLHTSQELFGLQSLADQMGVAIHNVGLYDNALNAQILAEKADQLKTRLLANVSHELRNPLNPIIGYSEKVLNNPSAYGQTLPRELIADQQVIFRNAKHLKRLVNDLLDLSRADIDELKISIGLLDPRPILEHVFSSMAESNSSVRPEITWQLQIPDRLPWIFADLDRLPQILFNLLSNAQKFTLHGKITLGAEVLPPNLHVWVADTGIGIHKSQQELIFEPFMTVEKNNRQNHSIGLGLAITRRLVSLHHGSITLESKVGEGSIFHLYLPLPRLNEHSNPTTFEPVEKPVLLVISTQNKLHQDVVDFARRLNLEIKQVANPLLMVDVIVSELRVVAIAWDLIGASPDEWATVQHLYSQTNLANVPFLLYSGEPEPDLKHKTGLTNVLLKPVSGQNLQQVINDLFSQESIGPILLVDDDPDAIELYRSILNKAIPYRKICTAENGLKAIIEIDAMTPSMVILDLFMPEMNGFDLLEWIRANPKTRSIPVVVLSGQVLSTENIRRLEQHARVTLHSKDILTAEEIASVFKQAIFEKRSHSSSTSSLVKNTLIYIHQNYSRLISRSDIAQKIGTTENYLSRVFQKELGISPWQYLKRFRIKQAKYLLIHSDETIISIAYKTGFTDAAYFSRTFHDEVGLSPIDYRRKSG